MAITTLPPAPSRASDTPQSFSDKMDALLGALAGFVSDTNTTAATINSQAAAVATNTALTEGYKLSAAASAAAAAQSVDAAAAAANATKWISGTTYAMGDVVWSPISFFNYRRKIAGAGTTDPSIDDTNWKLLGAPNSAPQQRISANTNAVSGVHYLMENPAAGLNSPYTLFFGASPVDGETRQVTILASIRTLNIDPAGKKIRNLPGIMTMDDLTLSRLWVFNAALDSWI